MVNSSINCHLNDGPTINTHHNNYTKNTITHVNKNPTTDSESTTKLTGPPTLRGGDIIPAGVPGIGGLFPHHQHPPLLQGDIIHPRHVPIEEHCGVVCPDDPDVLAQPDLTALVHDEVTGWRGTNG